MVDFTDDRLVQNAAILRDDKVGNEELRTRLGVKDNAGWKLAAARVNIKKTGDDRSFLKAYAYRPFDTRRIYYHPNLVWCDRRKVMSHTIASRNMAMATCRQLARLPWEHVFVTRTLQDDCFVSNRTRERSYHFPLHLHGESRQRGTQTELAFDQSGASTNFSASFLAALGIQLGQAAPAGDDVFGYIYCVLYSPEYRSRYAEFLRIDFPRIPLPASLDLFRNLARLGGELVALHLMESPKLDKFITTYTGPAKPDVGRVNWSQDTVWLDAPVARKGQAVRPGTIGFLGVPEIVWNFHIGGYQVCHKWLKDRGPKKGQPGRTLTKDDIAHYQKIVVALSETIHLMKEIDEVIEQHGGWPGAFTTEPVAETDDAPARDGPSCRAALPEAAGEADEKPDSQPWQMTRGEFHEYRVSQGFTNPTENSRLYWQEVETAIAEGKELHPHVLREYEQLFGSPLGKADNSQRK